MVNANFSAFNYLANQRAVFSWLFNSTFMYFFTSQSRAKYITNQCRAFITSGQIMDYLWGSPHLNNTPCMDYSRSKLRLETSKFHFVFYCIGYHTDTILRPRRMEEGKIPNIPALLFYCFHTMATCL